ncbi:efflux RND transporter periplasmic adaptor subunit [uncultured Arcticibacterium sp.]|uniref:efflux RND transporter periplasmic adaptor subunit n=1 Tax=uncultured Arcticibacterium sp. TaxID=2173042 RepID=UPI0030FAE589
MFFKIKAIILITCIGFLTSCKSETAQQEAGTKAPVKSYPVLALQKMSTIVSLEFPATLEGMENVNIHSKIDGFVEKIYVDEGAFVKKGQLLFTISAPQYEQLVRTSNAAIKSAEAGVESAKLKIEKVKSLVDKKIVSSYELQEAELNLKSAEALLAQKEAELMNAKVNLGYTRITSPVSGVIGGLSFKAGSLVSGSTPQPLTTVSNISNIFAYFSVTEKALLGFLRERQGSSVKEQLKSLPDVKLLLSDGQEYPSTGRIESIFGLIDAQTGTVRIRAKFPNKESLLRSGGSANLILPQTLENVFLVPQKAVTDLQGKKFVYVENEGILRSVFIDVQEAGSGQFYIVEKGLAEGDKVVLEGVQFLKDDMEIKPELVNAADIYKDL